MQTAVVCMLRDEIDLVDDFVSHHLAIVDCLYIADHLSSDGSFELLRARASFEPRLMVFDFDYEQHFQSAVVTALAHKAVNDGASWVFPLDADEFLPFTSAETLRDVLFQSNAESLVLRWRNIVPSPLPKQSGSVDWSRPLSTLPEPPGQRKVGVSAGLVKSRGFRFGEGSHHFISSTRKPLTEAHFGELLHIPIRSIDQARAKFDKGTQSLQHIYRRKAKQGNHWFALRDVFNGQLTEAEAVSIGLMYDNKVPRDVTSLAIPFIFVPNRHFQSAPFVGQGAERTSRSSRLTSEEARAVVVGNLVELHPRRLWRIRRIFVRTADTWRGLLIRLRRRSLVR